MHTNPNSARQGESIDDCALHRSERNRYFHGKLMSARDMQAEQRYYRGLFTRQASLVTGQGVVSGLEVDLEEADDPEEAFDVTLRPGYAVDCCGRPVVVPNETTVTVEPDDDVDGGSVWVSLAYEECVRETVPVPGSEDACEQECEYNRILEVFDIRLEVPDPDRSPSKPVPPIDFPSKADVEDDADAALDAISREYESQDVPVGCQNGEAHTVFLGQYSSESDGWERDASEHARSRVYTNDMLYAALTRHVADFENPHQVSLGIASGETGESDEPEESEELQEVIEEIAEEAAAEGDTDDATDAAEEEAVHEDVVEEEAAEEAAAEEAVFEEAALEQAFVTKATEADAELRQAKQEAAEEEAELRESSQLRESAQLRESSQLRQAVEQELPGKIEEASVETIRASIGDALESIRKRLPQETAEEPGEGAFLFVEDDERDDARVALTSSDATITIEVDESDRRIDLRSVGAVDRGLEGRVETLEGRVGTLERYAVDRAFKYTHEAFTRYLANPGEDFRPFTYGNMRRPTARQIAGQAADQIGEIRSVATDVINQVSPAEHLREDPGVLTDLQTAAAEFTEIVEGIRSIFPGSFERLEIANESLDSAIDDLTGDGGDAPMGDLAAALNAFSQAVVLLSGIVIEIRDIEGIGATFEERLREHNIRTTEELASRQATEVADAAQVSETRAKSWIDRARELGQQ